MPDCRIAFEMGFRSVWGSIGSGRAQKPHTRPTTPAPALKKNTRVELNTSMVLDALGVKSMDVLVRGCFERSMVSRRQKKREKVAAGPGSKECTAGHETQNYGKLRVRRRGLSALGERAENECAKAGVVSTVAHRAWPIQDIERDGEPSIIRV